MISEEYPGRISSRCKKYPPFREKAGMGKRLIVSGENFSQIGIGIQNDGFFAARQAAFQCIQRQGKFIECLFVIAMDVHSLMASPIVP